MSSLQITAYISSSERTSFEAYAAGCGLDTAGLLGLLLARELRLKRLPELVSRQSPEKVELDRKVTLHRCNEALKESIRSHATCAGTSVSKACAAIVRAELAERWLSVAMETRFESPNG